MAQIFITAPCPYHTHVSLRVKVLSSLQLLVQQMSWNPESKFAIPPSINSSTNYYYFQSSTFQSHMDRTVSTLIWYANSDSHVTAGFEVMVTIAVGVSVLYCAIDISNLFQSFWHLLLNTFLYLCMLMCAQDVKDLLSSNSCNNHFRYVILPLSFNHWHRPIVFGLESSPHQRFKQEENSVQCVISLSSSQDLNWEAHVPTQPGFLPEALFLLAMKYGTPSHVRTN